VVRPSREVGRGEAVEGHGRGGKEMAEQCAADVHYSMNLERYKAE
jgi:hypothetical protein